MPKLCTFDFMSREVRRLHSELDPLGGVDSLGFFSMFFKELTFVNAPNLSMVFRRLLRPGLFLLSGVVLMLYLFIRESCRFCCAV